MAERLRLAVAGMNRDHRDSPTADHVTVSLGGAVLVPREGLDEEILIGRADEALYRSKSDGRNRVTLAAPDAWASSEP